MTKYWFRQKTFGYGATPTTWQGWLVTLVSLVLTLGVVMLAPFISDNVLRGVWVVAGLAVVLVPTIWISWAKTEGGWRWRSGRD